MNKQKALEIVNPLLGVAISTVAVTGILHELIPWEVYHRVHPIAGFTAAALVAAHLALNWGWISAHYIKRRRG